MLPRINQLIAAFVISLVAGVQSASAGYMDTLNLTKGVTPISQEVYDLHMLILWIVVAIGIAVFAVMFYSMYAHRKSKGAVPATFHESTKVEILWTIVPFLILVAMAIPATNTLVFMADTTEAEVNVKITGHQWKWQYDYLDEEGVGFISTLLPEHRKAADSGDPSTVDNYLLEVDNELVLPVNTKIRFLLTASDVIHAWWVPELGQKQDTIPGFVNQMWTEIKQPGIYRGKCAELCGKDHGFMPIVVRAVSKAEYAAWIAEQKSAAAEVAAAAEKVWTAEDLYARGEEVYNSQCAGCHQINGMGLPGAFPAINGSPLATGPVADHLNIVMNGSPGTAMAAYKSQMNDVDIAAVVTYQRNAWDNKTGDMVQPADVKAAR